MSTTVLNLLLCFLAVSFVTVQATTIYASPSGSKSNTGTQSSPWDLNTALSNVAPGTTLQLLPGTYDVSANIQVETPGTSSQPITLQGNGQALLNWVGPNITDTAGDILTLSRYTNPPYEMYWVIDGVNFKNAGRAGLRLTWVEYVTVKNVDSGWNGVWGIFTSFSNYLFIDNVTCHHSNQQHGLYISNSCGNQVVQNSRFYSNAGIGIQHNGDETDGPGIPGYTTGEIVNSTIRNNLIWGNGKEGGGAINLDGVRQSYIYNNVIWGNHGSGIVNFAEDGVNPGSNYIVHNTIYFSDPTGHYGIGLHDGSDNNVIANNIIVTASSRTFAITIDGAGSGNVIDSNAVYVPGNLTYSQDGDTGLSPEEFHALGYGARTVLLGDPTSVFNNAAGSDFTEAAGAPTIKAADVTYSTINGVIISDFDGAARTASNDDMGAYQYGSAATTTVGGGSGSASAGASSSNSASSSSASRVVSLLDTLFY